MSDDRTLLLHTRDPLVERRSARVAERLGTRALQAVGPAGDETLGAPAGLLVQLELDDALATVRGWREHAASLVIVGYLTTPDPELWRQAEAAGCDLVTTRGRADRELAARVGDALSGRRAARRLRLPPEKDFAGRLGWVGRIEETPVGPIAIYHVDSRICAIADSCPHAGASLSDGELEGDVVTCPLHGSQFRVTDGERLRGPADLEVEAFRVVVDAGEVFVELPPDRA